MRKILERRRKRGKVRKGKRGRVKEGNYSLEIIRDELGGRGGAEWLVREALDGKEVGEDGGERDNLLVVVGSGGSCIMEVGAMRGEEGRAPYPSSPPSPTPKLPFSPQSSCACTPPPPWSARRRVGGERRMGEGGQMAPAGPLFSHRGVRRIGRGGVRGAGRREGGWACCSGCTRRP